MTTITPHVARSRTPGDPGPVATGVADIVPMVMGLVPYALAIGASAAAGGLSIVETLAGAWLLLAGAAQLAAIDLIGAGAEIWLTVSTTVMINLRLALYGAGVARWFAASSLWRRLALVVPIVDANFLLSEARFTEDHDQWWRTGYYLTISGSLIAAFTIGQLVGYGLGAGLPPGLGLHLAAPLAFVGMLARSLINPAGRRAAVAAAVTVVAVTALPIAWISAIALPAAIAAGVTTAGRTVADGDSRPGSDAP